MTHELITFDSPTARVLTKMVRDRARKQDDNPRRRINKAITEEIGLLFRTGEDGIPAGDGVVAGKAMCTMLFIYEDDEITEMKAANGDDLEREVWNVHTEAIEAGKIITARLIGAKPVADIPGGGSEGVGDLLTFEIPNDPYYDDNDVPPDCDKRVAHTERLIRVKVLGAPCERPFPKEIIEVIDGEAYLDVVDQFGFLDGRDYREILGKTGIAARIGQQDYQSGGGEGDSCLWVIIWINFFREVQVVTDIIFGEKTITIERANVKVWDDCVLPIEVVEGEDCEDEYAGAE